MQRIRSPPCVNFHFQTKEIRVNKEEKLMDKEYYLFVEGKKVVVSKEVYLAYHSELNKEKYQIRRITVSFFVPTIMMETSKKI